ncbi:MAG: probable vgr related protein, partial [uncultured Sphingomonadaceae bacterium]
DQRRRPPPDPRRGGPRPVRVRRRCRHGPGHRAALQMVPLATARHGHGAVRPHPLPPTNEPLPRRLPRRRPPRPRALHPRNDPRLADPAPRKILPAADAPPLLPLPLPLRTGTPLRPLRARATGRDRAARFPAQPRRPARRRRIAGAAVGHIAVSRNL